MTGRERVQRCLEFDSPDRVPRQTWILPIAPLEHGAAAIDNLHRRWPLDIAWAEVPIPALKARCQGDRYAVGRYTDEWGCTFENLQAGVIGEVKDPLIDEWSKLDRLRPPVEALMLDVDAVNRLCAATDLYVMAGGANPFERCQYLRGSENFYTDLAEEPAELNDLLRIVHGFNVELLSLLARTKVDAIQFADDWGSQRAMLISPAQWRRLFKPLYAQYVRIAHDAGKKIFMHSDGYIFDIYEDLIEIGIDAINSQLFCMDIPEIGRRFRGRITFWGEIDRQHILPHGSIKEVREAVGRVVENLYLPEGGVIAQFELGAAAKLENAHAIFEAWEQRTQPLAADGGNGGKR